MNQFLNLPGPVKSIALLGAGATLSTVLIAAASGNKALLLILFVSLATLSLFLGLYALVLRILKKRKAASMGKILSQHNTAAPSTVSKADARVRLDDLRQRFGEGVQKFKSAGKDLYSLPWYAIVGEPGSGKTEAIRHSNVGFPPGLQDELQGVGGTINMNWWFTNYGVVLDTAGKLLFEDVEPGKTSEWQEFLRLLRQARPNCPINGLILVIPTDSLIKDKAEEIERKARKIAVQLDEIQRVLDVRFPVFVLVTKADLIPGFREYFEGIEDPALQHQIFGWSNPEPLDNPFQPERVEEHVKSISSALQQRRYALLRDPVPQKPDGKFTDEVDALFPFPHALEVISPRLKRYLELIFVVGEWSRKPLFLRGIYFTSSLQEGSALDQDLAEAMGIEVDNLPLEGVFERERAFFLRDVILEKVFREKSLVTRATNTRSMMRRRQWMVFGSGFAALAMILSLAWYGARSLRASIGDQRQYWETAASPQLWSEGRWRVPVVDDGSLSLDWANQEDQPIPVGGQSLPLVEFLSVLRQLSAEEIRTPAIFRPLEFMAGAVSDRALNREDALRTLFEAAAFRPLVEGAREKMTRPAEIWDESSRDALAALIRMERAVAAQATGASTSAEAAGPLIQPLMRYLTREDGDTRWEELYLAVYADARTGRSWPPPWLSGGATLAENHAIRAGLERFFSYTRQSQQEQAGNLAFLRDFAAAVAHYAEAETAFLESARRDPEDPGYLDRIRRLFQTSLLPASREIERLQAELDARGWSGDETWFLLSETYRREVAAARDTIAGTMSDLQQAFGEPLPAGSGTTLLSEIRRMMQSEEERVAASLEAVFDPAQVGRLEELDREHLARYQGRDSLLRARWGLIEAAMRELDSQVEVQMDLPGAFVSALGGIERSFFALRRDFRGYDGTRLELFTESGRILLEAAESERLRRAGEAYLSQVRSRLGSIIGFPLVSGPDETVMELNMMQSVADLMARIRLDVERENLLRLPANIGRDFELLMNRLRPMEQLLGALVREDGTPALVVVSLPGQREQQERLRDYVAGYTPERHVNFIWDEMRMSRGQRVRTRDAGGGELGRLRVDESDLRFYFFRFDREEENPVSFQRNWAAAQVVAAGPALPTADPRNWDLVLTREREGSTYYVLVSLRFEQGLPRRTEWPTRVSLGLP